MKILKISAWVIGFHGCLIGLLLFQPGCNTVSSCNNTTNCPYITKAPGKDRAVHVIDDEELFTRDTEVVETTESTVALVDEASFADTFTPPEVVAAIRNKPLRAAPTRPSDAGFEEEDFEDDIVALIPAGGSSRASSAQASKTKEYAVKAGDSLWVIARRNGTTIDAILAANPGMTRNSYLKIGKKLTIPTGSKASKSTTRVATKATADGGVYTIAKGDTLSEIAARFKVSTADLKAANGMRNNTIYAGKQIVIPGVDKQTIASAPATPTRTKREMNKNGDYKVQPGESLSVIAHKFGVTVADLMRWNSISDARKLRSGQWLQVSQSGSKGSSTRDRLSAFESLLPSTEEVSPKRSQAYDPFDDDSLFDTSGESTIVSANSY